MSYSHELWNYEFTKASTRILLFVFYQQECGKQCSIMIGVSIMALDRNGFRF